MTHASAPFPPQLRLWGVPQLLPAPDAAAVSFAAERRFQLLLLLALERGQWLDRDRIAALLWPAHPLAEARRNLRKVVFRARDVPGAQALEATDHALRWDVATDLQALHDAGQRGDAAQGLALRRGPPLQGMDDPDNAALTEVLAAARARIDEAWLAAAHGQLQTPGTPSAQAAAARRILDVDPLDEPAIGALLRAEQACGRPAEAQAAYRRYAARLVDELGVEPSRALRDLVHGVPPPAAAGPELPPPRPASGAFVGRGLELAEAQELLAQPACRALTLLGPGGIGKSRLAQQLMARCAALFAGGVHWVALQDTAQLPAALARLAQALGVKMLDTGDPIDQLLRQLPRERLLLVLDNAEHLDELPAALQRLLDGAPAAVLLLTSRTRLHLRDEWVLPLPGLAVPDEDSRDLEAAASFDAVRLFEQCAHAARRDFVLARHLPAVIDIVEAVGGMPLAIELAAGWVRLLPPEQMAQDLRGSIDLLERDPAARGAPARPDHASLRAVLDGTWQLLAPREREALAALSVFEGGFTRAAAQAVAGCSLPLLSALVDKSLLAVDDAGRFAMHPVVQAYAAERLASMPAGLSRPALQDRHAAHFARQMVDLAPLARSAPARLAAPVDAEFANLRGAWRHALARGQAALLLDMIGPWRTYFENSGRTDEGLREFRAALALPEIDLQAAQLLARLRHAISALLFRRGEPAEALAMAQSGAASAERAGERMALKGCLNTQGLVLWQMGRAAEAMAPLERAKALALEDGDRYGVAVALSNLAIAEKSLGRFEAALAANQEALAIVRELGDAKLLNTRLHNIGNLHRALGQWQEARHWFDETLRHCQVHAVQHTVPYARLNRALVDIELGAFDAAAQALHAVLAGQGEMPQALLEMAAEMGLARIDFHHGRFANGRQRLVRVVQMARAKAFETHPMQALIVWGEALRAQGRTEEAATLWLVGAEHPVLEMTDRMVARRHLTALNLDDEACARLRERAPPEEAWLADLCGAP
ncbi:TPR_REGION domain-containing protein [Rubrivivax sp. A210]|uniref:ATP-binding protein n=1 Tax=Rubrivivax sp. A210 TaxID=2772301 RepID=UPI00191958DF|nr:BTAD domain-containing putative transcriptional regulator [Rubrivivax sp. A210]CAD5371007.1 TPR_REGION domain-containing protein [Rubrivivax sp. A210]